MAITWDLITQPLNIDEKRVSVTATRTDDVTGDEDTYRVDHAIIDTMSQKLAALDNIWAQHQANLAVKTEVETVIGTFGTDGKANLEARE